MVGKFSTNLAYALLGSLVALPAGCLVGGLAFFVWRYASGDGLLGLWQSVGLGASVSIAAVLIGIVPVLLYGAPAYALAATRYRPSMVAAIIIGLVPGLALVALSPEWGELFLWFGVPVAASLHLVAGRRISRHGADRSSGPTPHRGADQFRP